MADQLAESFRQARRELWFQLITWGVFAVWVVGLCGVTAFDAESPSVETTLGMPSWVLWGIAVPWTAAFAVTIYFAGWFMQDTELVDDTEAPASVVQDEPASTPADSSQGND